MTLRISGITIIVGNYGSGKSETAVNLAVYARNLGQSVKLADLDLVNPYFRSREAKAPLEAMGIEVVLPDAQYMHADLPILTPAVGGMIQTPANLTLLDAGGDDAGVTVLSALSHFFKGKAIQMLQVINPLRPFTGDVDGCLKIKSEIEASSGLKVTGLVSNANLIDQTTPEIIYQGHDLVNRVAQETGLEFKFITASTQVLPDLDQERITVPILPIKRMLATPWVRN